MKFIVQKYGGTSIGQADRMKSVAVIVKDSLKNDVFGMSSVLVMPNRSGPWLW
jgi:aspartokinase